MWQLTLEWLAADTRGAEQEQLNSFDELPNTMFHSVLMPLYCILNEAAQIISQISDEADQTSKKKKNTGVQ